MEPKPELFCQACIAGDAAKVKEMLKSEPALANAFGMVRADHREFMRKIGAEGGWSALHLAAHYGQTEVVRILAEAGADLDALSKNGEANTPLMAAVAGGSMEVVSLLVKRGADPLKNSANGELNAVKLAEAGSNPEIAAFLKAARVPRAEP
jgi:hypothetical protein